MSSSCSCLVLLDPEKSHPAMFRTPHRTQEAYKCCRSLRMGREGYMSQDGRPGSLTCCQTMNCDLDIARRLSISNNNEKKSQWSSNWCTICSQTKRAVPESPDMALCCSPALAVTGYRSQRLSILPRQTPLLPVCFSHCGTFIQPGRWTRSLDLIPWP